MRKLCQQESSHRTMINWPLWICFLQSLYMARTEGISNHRRQSRSEETHTKDTVRRSHNTDRSQLLATGAAKETDCGQGTLTIERPSSDIPRGPSMMVRCGFEKNIRIPTYDYFLISLLLHCHYLCTSKKCVYWEGEACSNFQC